MLNILGHFKAWSQTKEEDQENSECLNVDGLFTIVQKTIEGNNTDKATLTVFRENPDQISHST